MAAVVNGQYLNTESGLGGLFERLTTAVDRDAQNQGQLRGLALGGYGGLTPADAPPSGIFARLAAGLGLGGGASASAQPGPAAEPVIAPMPSSSPAPLQSAPPAPRTAGSPSPNALTALAFYQSKGLSPLASAGLVGGGFANESGSRLDPNSINRGDGSDGSNSIGIANWNGPRAQALQQFAAARGADPSDLQTQLEYSWAELNGPESKTLAALKAATNPLQATAAALGYERPAGWTPQNPFGAKSFGPRLASTVGLVNLPVDATAYAPAGDVGAGSTPAGAAVAAVGRQANAAAGGAPQPMPIATSSPSAAPTVQSGDPSLAATRPSAAGAQPQQPTVEQIRQLVLEPETRQLGLQLWQQSLSPKSPVFGKPGEVAFVNGRPTYQIPASPMAVAEGGAVFDPGTRKPLFANPKVETGTFQAPDGTTFSYDKNNPGSAPIRLTPQGSSNGFRPATAEERKAYGVQEGAPLSIGPGGKPSFGTGGTNVTLNNAIDPLQKAAGDRFDRSLTAADAAAKTIPAIRTAREQLNAGIISGAGANQILGLQKIGAQLGVTDPKRIQNTETFRSAVAPIVLQMVRGLGAGAGISNADRDFAEGMAGGNITADAGSIARMLDLQERVAVATIQQHNSLVDQIQQSPAGAAAYRNVGPAMRVAVPSPAASGEATKTIGGTTYTKGPDGRWYSQ